MQSILLLSFFHWIDNHSPNNIDIWHSYSMVSWASIIVFVALQRFSFPFSFFLNYCLFLLQADPYSPCCDPELVELRVPDLLISSTDQTSPPYSPSNSEPCTTSVWKFEEVDYKLNKGEKEEEDIWMSFLSSLFAHKM